MPRGRRSGRRWPRRCERASRSMSDETEHEALRWLGFALGDLEAARSRGGRPVRPRIVAFQARQAAEKALKAALILDGMAPRRTHDLDDLRERLPAGWRLKLRMRDLGRLSDYAAESRYPDDMTPVTAIQIGYGRPPGDRCRAPHPRGLRAPRYRHEQDRAPMTRSRRRGDRCRRASETGRRRLKRPAGR
jgi:HEPN domain-containing protein